MRRLLTTQASQPVCGGELAEKRDMERWRDGEEDYHRERGKERTDMIEVRLTWCMCYNELYDEYGSNKEEEKRPKKLEA